MKLQLSDLNSAAWSAKGVKLPHFDIAAMREKTAAAPEWVHFGSGNIFRGFIGSIAQSLLNAGLTETGIVAVETFDFDIIDMIYKPFDNLALNVLLGKEPGIKAEVLAGVADSVKADEVEKPKAIFANPSLKMLSYTITEKGYAPVEGGAMSLTADLLYHRYTNGAYPMAVVSMDNCSHNGEKLKNAVVAIANKRVADGLADEGFLDYLENTVSFPWSMIDKITPRPSDSVEQELSGIGVEDMKPIITSKGTYIAPFVNAEIPQYLVVEDDFPNGRPPLEKAGVYMTTRETVNKAETMKVTTCLNPLHTALAVYGCMLGYNRICDEMQDADLVRLVKGIASEGMKVVVDPEIIDPRAFADEVINDRLPNPNIPDMPQRIATDTSQKVGIRYGETIKSYMKSEVLDTAELKAVPAAIAGWLRYLLGVDDEGNAFEKSADPLADKLAALVDGIKLGDVASTDGKLKPLLSDSDIFGADLYEAGLGEKIEQYFKAMLKGTGAVREFLISL